jgi:hypothetical protein
MGSRVETMRRFQALWVNLRRPTAASSAGLTSRRSCMASSQQKNHPKGRVVTHSRVCQVGYTDHHTGCLQLNRVLTHTISNV